MHPFQFWFRRLGFELLNDLLGQPFLHVVENELYVGNSIVAIRLRMDSHHIIEKDRSKRHHYRLVDFLNRNLLVLAYERGLVTITYHQIEEEDRRSRDSFGFHLLFYRVKLQVHISQRVGERHAHRVRTRERRTGSATATVDRITTTSPVLVPVWTSAQRVTSSKVPIA